LAGGLLLQLEQEQWEYRAAFLAEEAVRKLSAVLSFPGGWMSGHTNAEGGKDDSILQQLKAIRQICLPEVCSLLHSVLHSSGLYKKCLRISDLVASEVKEMYKDFSLSERRKLLDLFESSALKIASDPATDELGY
jgi:nuclear pore complex protein Nup107